MKNEAMKKLGLMNPGSTFPKPMARTPKSGAASGGKTGTQVFLGKLKLPFAQEHVSFLPFGHLEGILCKSMLFCSLLLGAEPNSPTPPEGEAEKTFGFRVSKVTRKCL